MAILTVGIDTAKNVFALQGVNEAGRPELRRPSVPRSKLLERVASLPPCTIGIEACTGSHHWARCFAAHGHTVRLMAPKFVAPYRMSGARGKTDAADAAAISEAVQRPTLRFVPIKTEDQQSRLMVHRARQGFVAARTATLNRIRGLLSEVHHLDERVAQYDVHIRTMARTSTPAQQWMQLMGIGATTATAIVAMVGNGREFDSGRQFAAWLGLVPGQYSSGGKTRLGRITKAGDACLRSLVVSPVRTLCRCSTPRHRSVALQFRSDDAE